MSPPNIRSAPSVDSSQRGTTLLEIVITVAIMTIGMLGFFTLHMRSFATSANAATMTQAAAYASALQDQLMTIPLPKNFVSMNLASMQNCGPITVDSLADLCRQVDVMGANGEVLATAGAETKGFHRSYQVQHLPETEMAGQTVSRVQITVRVRYPSDGGRCDNCATFKRGWKAVTMSSMRTIAAY